MAKQKLTLSIDKEIITQAKIEFQQVIMLKIWITFVIISL